MTEPTRSAIPARTADLLHAYRDGELSGFARWRLERRLRRSPAATTSTSAASQAIAVYRWTVFSSGRRPTPSARLGR